MLPIRCNIFRQKHYGSCSFLLRGNERKHLIYYCNIFGIWAMNTFLTIEMSKAEDFYCEL
uniref:Uncharacterized protein n=1 Tax=Glossina austeni TaxID=7395 RepID=A0A1A9UJ89_GLOAU